MFRFNLNLDIKVGVPAVLTSIWNGVCSVLEISPSTTTSFHPQRFHRSLKSSLKVRLAGLYWFSHLPLVHLGLRATPKDDTGLSVSEAVYGSPLTMPGELVDVPELPPESFLRKVERAIDGFAVPPPHHVHPVPPSQLPAALLKAKFMFVC